MLSRPYDILKLKKLFAAAMDDSAAANGELASN